jgi:hypothetical protein
MKYLATLALAALSFSSFAQSGHDSPNGKSAWKQLSTMVGTWETGGAQKMKIVYRMTGGGSALMETMFPGTNHEMVTMYHLDKNRLVLTHYCAAMNQPTMTLMDGSANSLHFVFTSGSNMDNTDMHMHEMSLHMIDKNHVHEDWQAYSDGKPGETMKFDLHRVG